MIKKTLKKILGIKNTQTVKKNRFLEFIKPDFIFDVGANVGMSGQGYINSGFTNEIYSFEPVSHLFDKLNENASKYQNWKTFKCAIGNKNETLKINVSGGHGGSSSFLRMTDEFEKIAPDQIVFKVEEVPVITLSEFYNNSKIDAKRIFLKIDVQGFEMNVLEGAKDLFNKIVGIKIETSIIKQYTNEADIFYILPFLLDSGFSVYAFENGWRNPMTQELLQVDILLFNKNLI